MRRLTGFFFLLSWILASLAGGPAHFAGSPTSNVDLRAPAEAATAGIPTPGGGAKGSPADLSPDRYDPRGWGASGQGLIAPSPAAAEGGAGGPGATVQHSRPTGVLPSASQLLRSSPATIGIRSGDRLPPFTTTLPPPADVRS